MVPIYVFQPYIMHFHVLLLDNLQLQNNEMILLKSWNNC